MTSILKVDTIQDASGGNEIKPSALVKEIDMWFVSTSPEPTGSVDHNPITGWERRTQFFSKIGTGLTYTSSNGGFALPSAGTWRIFYRIDFHIDNDDTTINIDLDTSSNGGVNFPQDSGSRILRHQVGKKSAGNDTRGSLSGSVTFTVTTSQLANFRFRWRLHGVQTDLVIQTQQNNSHLRTHFSIERLAD